MAPGQTTSRPFTHNGPLTCLDMTVFAHRLRANHSYLDGHCEAITPRELVINTENRILDTRRIFRYGW